MEQGVIVIPTEAVRLTRDLGYHKITDFSHAFEMTNLITTKNWHGSPSVSQSYEVATVEDPCQLVSYRSLVGLRPRSAFAPC